jgi:ferredoxin
VPKITINGETFDAGEGENLLALARRHAAHVWFVCDGRGLCQTCECRILSGAEILSRPSKIELESMTDSRRDRGCRLACQTKIIGPGSISLVSAAEELRKQAATLIDKPEGTTLAGNAGQLAGKLSRFALDFTRSLPAVAVSSIPQIISLPPRISGIRDYFRDSWKVTERLLRSR